MATTSTIYPDYDGVVYNYVTDTWNNVRNASSGTLNTAASYNVTNSHTSGRGGNTYNIGRYFLEFDTSSINKTISSATFQLYGNSTSALDVILFKSSQTGAVGTGDFNEIAGAGIALALSNGSGGGSLASSSAVVYSNEVATWDTSDYNTFTLTAAAKADFIANDTFNCVMIGWDYDGRDTAVSSATYQTGFYQDAQGATSSDPKLVITEQDNSVFFGANF